MAERERSTNMHRPDSIGNNWWRAKRANAAKGSVLYGYVRILDFIGISDLRRLERCYAILI